MNKAKLLGVIRHILTFGGGFLVAKGTIEAEVLDQTIAALITVIGTAWSFFAPEKS